MSCIALATDAFDEMTQFDGERLQMTGVGGRDRPNGRDRRYDVSGLTLEILDKRRRRQPVVLGWAADRVDLGVEVEDIEAARGRLGVAAPPARDTPWPAMLFVPRDSDGVPATFPQCRVEDDPA